MDELKIFTGARRKQLAKDGQAQQESRRRSRSSCSRKEKKAKEEKEPDVIEVIEVPEVSEVESIPSDGLAAVILPKQPPPTTVASESIVDKIKNSLKSNDSNGDLDDKPGLVWDAIDKKEKTTEKLEEVDNLESVVKSTNPLPPAPTPSPPANHVGKSDSSVIDRQALDESGNRLLASLTHGCFSDDLRKSAADLVSLSRG